MSALRDRLALGAVHRHLRRLRRSRGASAWRDEERGRLLSGWVDAVNLTDNQGAHVRMSSWAAALAARDDGLEPIMQMTCRDRNRIALQSDLLGAACAGLENVVFMTGDHPKFGDHPGAKPVFDLDSVTMLWTARTMRDEGKLLSGNETRRRRKGCSSGRWRTPSRRRRSSAPRAPRRRSRPGRAVPADPVRVRRAGVRALGQGPARRGLHEPVLDPCRGRSRPFRAGAGVPDVGEGAQRDRARGGAAKAARGSPRPAGGGGPPARRRGHRPRQGNPRGGRRPPAHRRVREGGPGPAGLAGVAQGRAGARGGTVTTTDAGVAPVSA